MASQRIRVGYLIGTEGKTIYHAGDTDFIPEMCKLKNIDLALLPTGDKYTMDNSEAAEVAIAISPRAAMAMHTWQKDREEFKQKTEAKSRTKVVRERRGRIQSLALLRFRTKISGVLIPQPIRPFGFAEEL